LSNPEKRPDFNRGAPFFEAKTPRPGNQLWDFFLPFFSPSFAQVETGRFEDLVRSVRIRITVEDILTIPQAAKELGVHRATIYRWIDKGIVHPFRIAGQVFVTVDDVKSLKEKRGNSSET